MKKTPSISVRFSVVVLCGLPLLTQCGESADPISENDSSPAAVAPVPCSFDTECEPDQYCKIGAFKPGKADGHLFAGICAAKLERQRVVGDPPNPSGGGGGGSICKGDFTLGFTNIHGPPTLGQACWPREKPENCADGTWLYFPSAFKCYCIAKCATLGKTPGEWCDPETKNFVCLHVIGDHAAADEAEVCVKPSWKLCTDGSEGEWDRTDGTGGNADEGDTGGKGDTGDTTDTGNADEGDTGGKDDTGDTTDTDTSDSGGGDDTGDTTDTDTSDGGGGDDTGDTTDADTSDGGDGDGKTTTTGGSGEGTTTDQGDTGGA